MAAATRTPLTEAEVSALKEAGNAAASRKKWSKAVECYSKVVDAVVPPPPAVLSNRAAAWMELGRPADALADAQAVVAADPGWWKGWFRLALAHEALGDAPAALTAVRKAVDAAPAGTSEVDAAFKRVSKAVAAAEALAAEEKPELADCLKAALQVVNVAAAAASVDFGTFMAPHTNVVCKADAAKGRALVTTRPVAAGEAIMEEAALAWYSAFADGLGATIPRLMEVAPWFKGDVYGALVQLAPYSSAAHGSANRASEETVRATASKAEIAIRVAGANALACNWNDALSQEERHISVIAMATAMCNHACAPTARYTSYWDAKRACPVIRLYALSDIPAGGEVTISYTDVSASKADRQAALARYGFVCACSRCAPTWDDTMVLKCAACETGRLYVGAPACADCGADAGDSAQPDGALAKQREEYLSGHRFLPQIALYDSRTNSVVHLCDATRLNAAYQQLHTAWGLEADVAAEVYRALMPAFEKARVQWNAQMPQLRVLAGHVYTAAGLREDAAREYTAAVAEYRAAYGAEAAITQMVQALVDRPPRSRADVEAFEQKRVSTASWVTACGLPRKTAQRWLQPITVSAAASIMGHGAGASGSTKAEQVVVNELIRCTQIAKSLGLAPAPTSAPAVEAAAGAGTAAEVAA